MPYIFLLVERSILVMIHANIVFGNLLCYSLNPPLKSGKFKGLYVDPFEAILMTCLALMVCITYLSFMFCLRDCHSIFSILLIKLSISITSFHWCPWLSPTIYPRRHNYLQKSWNILFSIDVQILFAKMLIHFHFTRAV